MRPRLDTTFELITPLLKTDDYLGDVYTLEFDFWGNSDQTPDNQIATKYYLEFIPGKSTPKYVYADIALYRYQT